MRKALKYSFLFIITITLIMLVSCREDIRDESFYPDEMLTISDFLEQHKDTMNVYYRLVYDLGYLKALSAYNPYGNNYTLFLPTDEAFRKFFADNNDYSGVEDLLADSNYAETLVKYHIVNSAFKTSDFPFGSLADTTPTGDYLTIAIDTSDLQPRINGEAAVLVPDIELINGYIHIIDRVLKPVTFPISEWIDGQDRFSIMKEVFRLTGFFDILASDRKFTVLLETNDILNADSIYSVDDLIEAYSPDSPDYTDPDNGLYQFAAYHILEGIYFLDDFEGNSANYNTETIYPVNIDGEGLNIKINSGVGILDTIIKYSDTTYIDYIGINYESSNNQAMNGAIHLVNHTLSLYLPDRGEVINQFYNEPSINSLKNDPGEYTFNTTDDFRVIDWSGTEELKYIKSGDEINGVWNNDYIVLDGNFTFKYEIPRLLPGKYNFYMNAHALDDQNAAVNIFFDGVQVGGTVDLTSGGSDNNPYYNFLLGIIELKGYVSHTIEIRTLVPGTFYCDRFTFSPKK